MTTATILQLVDKTSDWDKDERYMATNDLCNLLSKDTKIDEHIEQKICAAILKQLDDPSNDVKSVAVKCLGVLVKKVHQNQIGEIAKKLADLVISGQDALRDIYSIGLKTLINDVSEAMGHLVCDRLSGKLLTGVSAVTNEEVKRECLENLLELLKRFGHLCDNQHQGFIAALVELLKAPKPPLRKRATNCLGALAVVLSDPLLTDLMSLLLSRINELSSRSSSVESRSYIQSIGTISRQVGYRLGKYLPQIIPLFITFCGDPGDESTFEEEYNDLRESIFPGLESFVLRCPKEVTVYVQDILSVSLAFSKYDPNYSYDSSEEDAEDYMDEDYGDEENYGSGDDDTSWKVRKSALKVVHAIVITHKNNPALFEQIADELLGRFKEREESVQVDVIACFSNLLRNVGEGGSSSLLQGKVEKIMHTSLKQLQGKSLKAKIEILVLMKTLVEIQKGGLVDYFDKIMSITGPFLKDKNQGLKIETLQLLRLVYSTHSPSVVQSTISSLLPSVLSIIMEEGYKTIAEALRLLSTTIQAMKPSVQIGTETAEGKIELEPDMSVNVDINAIYEVLMKRLEVMDIDSEIKECAISTTALYVSYLGDLLDPTKLTHIFAIFQKRIDHESSRLITLKGVESMAKSSLQINLTSFLQSSTTSYLYCISKQYNRSLRLAALQSFVSLLKNKSTAVTEEIYSVICRDMSSLISDQDLPITTITLQVLLTLIQRDTRLTSQLIYEHMYNKLLCLVASNMLLGGVLDGSIEIIQCLLNNNVVTFEALFTVLYTNNTEKIENKHALSNISKCIAGICACIERGKLYSSIVPVLLSDIVNNSNSSSKTVLALYTVGNLGHSVDLSSVSNLYSILAQCFDQNEESKLAAAYALGHVTLGSMSFFLPLLLQSFQSNAKHSYLLLIAFKEILTYIYSHNQIVLVENAVHEQMITMLKGMTLTQSGDESIRTILSDCLGVYLHIHCGLVSSVLEELSSTQQNSVLVIVLHSLKACLTKHLTDSNTFQAIQHLVAKYSSSLKHEDIEVKKSGMLMINTAIHHNPAIIEGNIVAEVYPEVMQCLLLKMEKVVDLGPFKHKVDDALPLRKLCLSFLEMILQNMPHRFDAIAVMNLATTLLNDHDDIKLLFLQLLPRVCEADSTAVSNVAEDLIPLLEKVLEKNIKEIAEKGASANTTSNKETLKSVLRVVLRVDQVEEVKSMRKWTDFSAKVHKAESLAELLRGVESEALDTI